MGTMASASVYFHQVADFKASFDLFCTSGSGFITTEELRSTMSSLGMQSNEQELEKLMKEADLDEDGVISFPEFMLLMLQRMQQVL